jgi:hypothetical protein
MGCDFFYWGKLTDTGLQEKVIECVAEYYEEKALLIQPHPGNEYFTGYNMSDSLHYPEGLTRLERSLYRLKHAEKRLRYPFNYYGVIPLYGWELEEYGQFIFDRSTEGQLVRFLKLPDDLGLPARDECYKKDEAAVLVKEGGYDRIIGDSFQFAVLLSIINLRWLPELDVEDDYDVYATVAKILRDSGLVEAFKDKSANYQKCWNLFRVEYERRLPDILWRMPISDSV